MDVTTFVVEMTKALAWPVAAIWLSHLFRRPVVQLVEGMRLRRISRGEWSADFEAQASEVRAELPHPSGNVAYTAAASQLEIKIHDLVEDEPTAAIVQAWRQLEDRVTVVAEQNGVREKRLPEILSALVGQSVIPPSTRHAILGLRSMRNLAVHAPPGRMTTQKAREFITMVEAIMWTLQQQNQIATP